MLIFAPMKVGELLLAEVDSTETVVYLSMITEEKGEGRPMTCFRLAPPSHEIVTGSVKVIGPVDRLAIWKKARTKP